MAVHTILILEDDPASAGLYQSVLERAGFHAIAASDFERARELLRASLPDALLTDVRLAEYNGLQLAILFRTLAPSAPILVVSGHDDPVIRREVANISGATFLAKPIDMDELAEFFSR